jgi:hypothetical protein
MIGNYQQKTSGLIAILAGLALANPADALTLTRIVNAFSVDYVTFSTSGNGLTIDIFGNGFRGGTSPLGLFDSEIVVFQDNNSPIGALTGTLIASNLDGGSTASTGFGDGSTSTNDSFLALPSLSSGSYILAVGNLILTESEARSGIANTPTGDRDYQVTFTGDFVTTAVPFEFNPGLGLMLLAGTWLAKKVFA